MINVERETAEKWQGSIAAVAWLRAILHERFGLPLELRVDRASSWVLTLPNAGDDRAVIIDLKPAATQSGGIQQRVFSWDAAREGWHSALDKPLPAPGVCPIPFPLIEKRGNDYAIRYDILGLVYWSLTRLEEIDRTDLDEHRRFPAMASHAFQHGYLERPVVDEWLDILGQVVRRTWPGVELKRHRFSMRISHDVDSPSRYGFCSGRAFLRAAAADFIKYRDVRVVAAPWVRFNTRARLHPLDAFNTFDWLMEVSERHGLTSAFYFICDRRATAHDSDYDVEHPAIRDLMRRIHARGHEIGLHPSYNTFLEPAQIKLEADRLRDVCSQEGIHQEQWGGRMHYLQWRQPVTLRAWNDAGMTYDSTMGYADRVGFRCGTCFEFPAFDPVRQEALQLRVRPLVVMEGTAFGHKYMGLGITDAARNKMLELKQICRKVEGSFTLLWHNSSLQTDMQRYMYEAVVNA